MEALKLALETPLQSGNAADRRLAAVLDGVSLNIVRDVSRR
jgi:hypothetical protein